MIRTSHKSDEQNGSEYAKFGERRMRLMVPFQKITEACKNTGLSQYYLRQGCKTAQFRTSGAAAFITSMFRL